MEVQYSFLIMVLLYLVWSCNCQLDDLTHLMQQKQNKKYCGRHLTEALAALCEGNYNTLRPVFRKKSYWDSQFNADLPADQFPGYPFQTRSDATSMLGNYGKRRRRRGVYNECCEKSCTRDQLSLYCAASPSPRPK